MLHYIAKVILRSDANLINFIEEMPHVEAAARGELGRYLCSVITYHCPIVSVQTVTASVQSLVVGLDQVREELKRLEDLKSRWSNDRFVSVMQVYKCSQIQGLSAAFTLVLALRNADGFERGRYEEDVNDAGERTYVAFDVLRRKIGYTRSTKT